MPANLTPEYLEAERQFRQATTPEEQIEALQRMLALLPKHKGTEKIQADLKRKLAKLREVEQTRRVKRAGTDPYYIPRHGAGQVVVIGPANAGKSLLVSQLSGVPLEVADYPYTTQKPTPVMMPFEDLQIQLIDTPPVVGELEGPLASLIRRADETLLVLDLSSDDCLDQVVFLLESLDKRRIRLVKEARPDDPVRTFVERPAIIVGNKLDQPRADERQAVLKESLEGGPPFVAVSALLGEGLVGLRRQIFDQLGVIRVYAKPPGKEPDLERPFVLKKGATVMDLAEAVHRDFPDRLKYARVWGSAEFAGQSVGKTFLLSDRDIVELHL
ncbi:MAG: TGS domain-containing protein [Armatimonadetes bacterium]|nr:TGS domain-containing protein [Armatimonadota bacterium]MDW8121080.1 TGS domain-containing protein [Armatimonadota bacterium]